MKKYKCYLYYSQLIKLIKLKNGQSIEQSCQRRRFAGVYIAQVLQLFLLLYSLVENWP